MATDVKNDATLSTSLVSYWELEETSGTRVDSHGSNDLTDNNTVTSTTGIQGTAASFDKTNSEFLSISDASQSGLDFSGDFSFSCWVKRAGVGVNVYLFAKRQVSSNNGFQINIDSDDTLLINYYNAGNTTSIRSDATVYDSGDIGNWVHIAFKVDVSAATAEVWKNGSALGATAATSAATSVGNSTEGFSIGVVKIGANYYDYYDSDMDEVGVWSKLLSSAEVSDLYNSGSGIPYDAGGAAPTFIPKVVFF